MTTYSVIGGDLDEAEAAAALAAVTCVLEAEAAALASPAAEGRKTGWSDTARLITQGLIPSRLPAPARWSSIERLRRAGRGGSGIVGQ